MKITKKKQAEMLEAARPLIRWMNENCHPHCTAHVDQTTIELTEGTATVTTLFENIFDPSGGLNKKPT